METKKTETLQNRISEDEELTKVIKKRELKKTVYDIDESEQKFLNELQLFIKKKHKSLRTFSISAGIPYTTIVNLFTRGACRVRMETLIKIAIALNLDYVKLLNYEIVSLDYKYIDTAQINEDEKKVLHYFRFSDEDGKAFILSVAEREANRSSITLKNSK